MSKYHVYSSQTGMTFGYFEAESNDAALNAFARQYGYASCAVMWRKGHFEYMTASQVQELPQQVLADRAYDQARRTAAGY